VPVTPLFRSRVAEYGVRSSHTLSHVQVFNVAGAVFLALFSINRVATSLFPTDIRHNAPEEVKAAQDAGDFTTIPMAPLHKFAGTRTLNGLLHWLFAFLSFSSIVVASLNWADAVGALPSGPLSDAQPVLKGAPQMR